MLSTWVRIYLDPPLPAWYDNLLFPGVVVPWEREFFGADEWVGIFLEIGNWQRTYTFSLESNDLPASPEPNCKVRITLLAIPLLIGDTHEELHSGDFVQQSKKTPHLTAGCFNVSDPPAGCTSGAFTHWDWWPSCRGVPAPGPEVPTA